MMNILHQHQHDEDSNGRQWLRLHTQRNCLTVLARNVGSNAAILDALVSDSSDRYLCQTTTNKWVAIYAFE